MNFQFRALDSQEFAHLFALSDEALERHHARRVKVSEHPGTPCRVSLEDAQIGENVILVNYVHMSLDTPYRASHAIYVRESVKTATPKQNEIPALLLHRTLSVRAFDKEGMMIDADVVEGTALNGTIGQLFATNASIAELHIHYAKPGCFAARVTRA
ncbi:DUF1203 domain-containing protein [Ahrensia kielensis]|uniref:DUF1203 domain-containing protein n=1 Tax=Ahrensia kielensis TaxID=76980 RepID=A0ABU9T3S6_9HYPH